MTTTTIPKSAKKYIDIIKSGIIQEREIVLMRSLMNNNKEAATAIYEAWNEDEIGITEEQGQKGYDFLMNQWKSPSGKERKNNPFGYREQHVLETFSHFTLHSLYDNSRYGGRPNLLPIYACYDKDGASFEYYYDEKVNIVG